MTRSISELPTRALASFALASLASLTMIAAVSAEEVNKPAATATSPPAAAEKAVDSMAGTELNDADCTSLWLSLKGSETKGLNAEQVKDVVSDFKKANPDGDDTIDQTEWMAACKGKLVHKADMSKPAKAQ